MTTQDKPEIIRDLEAMEAEDKAKADAAANASPEEFADIIRLAEEITAENRSTL